MFRAAARPVVPVVINDLSMTYNWRRQRGIDGLLDTRIVNHASSPSMRVSFASTQCLRTTRERMENRLEKTLLAGLIGPGGDASMSISPFTAKI
ncbi:hypothetical protein A9R05_39405 (plasmid) [Burkholderia sp. KK1]|nr:hypothetical protein A9R05_39405 [Burkholderia sp. KK1]